MERKTTPGRTYAIYSTLGCTVTNGSETVTVPAATTTYVTAYRGDIEISDDAAECVEVFKLAPIGLLGGGGNSGGSGGGNSSGGDGKNTLRYVFADDGSYSVEGDLSGLVLEKKLTTWNASLASLQDGNALFRGFSICESWTTVLTLLENGLNMFTECSKHKSWNVDLPSLKTGRGMFSYSWELGSFKSYLPVMTDGQSMFAGDSSLKVFEADLPALDNGSGMFSNCQLDKNSALRVLNSIPTYTSGTHNLTIGIHVDHQNDAEVLAAIDAATAKGWTLTVQWNGTATT